MKDLFDNDAARNIINFIKESHFYSTEVKSRLHRVLTAFRVYS